MKPDVRPVMHATLLVCTFNRSDDLRDMLESALAQDTEGSFTYDVLVVDNNSSDGTRAVVEDLIARGHRNLKYLFEGQQGKSYALNTGLRAVRGDIYTIADDDFILPPRWLRGIVEGFRMHPDVSFVSGKVLPQWQGEIPGWLTPDLWSALALADYGDREFFVDRTHQRCLLACSFRRADVEAVGGYHSALGVTKDVIGGVEDLEILQRLWKAGRRGVYLPHLAFYHKVPASRLTKSYHRRWHTGHGRFYAMLRDEDYERSAARLFDVPAHLYKSAAAAALQWGAATLRGSRAEAFACETRVRFFLGFFHERRRQYAAAGGRPALRELSAFVRDLLADRFGGRALSGADPR